MKLPRDLSGADLVQTLCKHYGYRRLHQEGSHIILETSTPAHHRISIPNHNPLRVGTLNAILQAVARVQGLKKEGILQRLWLMPTSDVLPSGVLPARTTVQSVLWNAIKVEIDCVARKT